MRILVLLFLVNFIHLNGQNRIPTGMLIRGSGWNGNPPQSEIAVIGNGGYLGGLINSNDSQKDTLANNFATGLGACGNVVLNKYGKVSKMFNFVLRANPVSLIEKLNIGDSITNKTYTKKIFGSENSNFFSASCKYNMMGKFGATEDHRRSFSFLADLNFSKFKIDTYNGKNFSDSMSIAGKRLSPGFMFLSFSAGVTSEVFLSLNGQEKNRMQFLSLGAALFYSYANVYDEGDDETINSWAYTLLGSQSLDENLKSEVTKLNNFHCIQFKGFIQLNDFCFFLDIQRPISNIDPNKLRLQGINNRTKSNNIFISYGITMNPSIFRFRI